MLTLPNANPMPSRRRKLRDSGHLLLAVLLMMALMVIAATYEAPRVVQQLKRDREEEMIHRGTEYARAIKKYYKKMGSYPSTIEQLENTNNIRFLRKRYKDPLTKDGKWTLLHYNDVINTLATTGGPGIPAAGLASQGQPGLGTPAGQQGSSTFGSSFAPGSTSTSGGFGTSTFGSANHATGESGRKLRAGAACVRQRTTGDDRLKCGKFRPAKHRRGYRFFEYREQPLRKHLRRRNQLGRHRWTEWLDCGARRAAGLGRPDLRSRRHHGRRQQEQRSDDPGLQQKEDIQRMAVHLQPGDGPGQRASQRSVFAKHANQFQHRHPSRTTESTEPTAEPLRPAGQRIR